MDNIKEVNKKSKVKIGPIMSVLIGLSFFTLILFLVLSEVSKTKKPKYKQSSNNTTLKADDKTSEHNQPDINITAIVLEVNKSEKTIRLYDIDKREEITLTYTGGSNFLDKFGQPITAGHLDAGLIADIGYQKGKNKIINLQKSLRAWEYAGVNNMLIDTSDKTIKIAQSNYAYFDPVIVDNGKFINIEDLAPQDILTVRGIDETIWSVIVTKGHGTVRITDCDAFLGGSLTIGYEAVTDITENMVITVREGNYNLTVENGEYSGTKSITVNRNEETVVSIGDLGPGAIPHGLVTFDITPFGADLFINDELTPYANPVKLKYGEHSIEVSLGGYSTFKGSLKVDTAEKKVQIILPELQSREPVSVVETTGTSDTDYSDTENPAEYIVYNNWDDQSADDSPGSIDIQIDEESVDNDPIVDEEHLIYIQNPKGASVYLNGEYKGVSPGSFQKVIGRHVLTFIRQGYQTKSYTIDISDDGMDTYISLPDLIPDN